LPRFLLIGCGCRGTMLARELIAHGHVVRGTSRDRARLDRIERAGAEAVLADPDRVATVSPALEHVAVACVLLGSAAGAPAQLEALHSTRLDMLLTRILDSPVRGIVYESRGTVPRAVLDGAAARVRAFCEDSRIPYALLEADGADHQAWLAAALAAVERVLG
jgi:uncharacterized protein YbjT (DUF2867 family)